MKKKDYGLIHIYYGQGVGKTSRAVGMAIRAAGEGLLVDFVQFMKSGNSGEVAIFEKIHNIRYSCPGEHPFVISHGPEEVHYKHAETGLRYALEAVEKETDLLICDEMLDTIIFDLQKEEQLFDLMMRCKNKVELILTGRDASPKVIESADYATEFIQIKHAYYCGARARKGIEY